MLGNAKGVVAATISVLLFHNPVTAMSMTGYAITVCGVVAYSQVASWCHVPLPSQDLGELGYSDAPHARKKSERTSRCSLLLLPRNT